MDFKAKSGNRSPAIGTISKTSILSLLLLIPALLQLVVVEAANEGLDPTKSQPCSLKDPLMDPTHEKRYGVDVVWQIPPNPKGVLFLGHGTGFDGLSYFDPGPKCEQCYGLPESRTITLDALRRDFAVINVKSLGKHYDVIDLSLETSEDLVIATNVLKEWIIEHSLETLPLAAWGQSSGSMIASALTTTLSMQALVLMCGQGLLEVQELATPITHPPTLFAYMPRDFGVAEVNLTGKQQESMAVLTERGVRVTGTACLPKPLSPLFFTERILCMSESMSRQIFAAYEAAGWVDSRGYMTMDPDLEDWKAVLLTANALPFCEASEDLCLIRHVEQELKTAFAVHALSSNEDDIIFPWLERTITAASSQEGSGLQHGALVATS